MESLQLLIGAAVGIGFVHTLIGFDHTLPFVVLSRARGWSLGKTISLTLVCGLGHVLSSVLLGAAGIAAALAATGFDGSAGHGWISARVGSFESFESIRGDLSAWALILFGLVYAAWSLARRRRQQRHVHEHDGVVHAHGSEGASGEHSHHDLAGGRSLTGWSLFVIFVLGPCEPLIPVLMVPAFQIGLWAVVPVTLAFALTTLVTMAVVVGLASWGLNLGRFPGLEAHAHLLSGLAISSSGVAMLLFAI